MVHYKDNRLIDGKPRRVVIDEEGNITNRQPSKEELKGLEWAYHQGKQGCIPVYTDEELLNYLKKFYYDNGRAPKRREFEIHPDYPGKTTYCRRFGSWKNALEKAGILDKMEHVRIYTSEEISDSLFQFYETYGQIPKYNDFRNGAMSIHASTILRRFGTWNNALKTVGLDPDTLIKKGIGVNNSNNKGRRFELYVGESFNEIYEDLSGKNHKSSLDGICPNGLLYEAKSSSFDRGCWDYHFYNSEKERVRWYYLGAFDAYFEKLLYVWRVPSDVIVGERLYVGLTKRSQFNVENMKRYEITDIFLKTLKEKNITW